MACGEAEADHVLLRVAVLRAQASHCGPESAKEFLLIRHTSVLGTHERIYHEQISCAMLAGSFSHIEFDCGEPHCARGRWAFAEFRLLGTTLRKSFSVCQINLTQLGKSRFRRFSLCQRLEQPRQRMNTDWRLSAASS